MKFYILINLKLSRNRFDINIFDCIISHAYSFLTTENKHILSWPNHYKTIPRLKVLPSGD